MPFKDPSSGMISPVLSEGSARKINCALYFFMDTRASGLGLVIAAMFIPYQLCADAFAVLSAGVFQPGLAQVLADVNRIYS